ncbi:hypothetical protein OKW21_006749 [Catalinimonas alkaloidigena]|uniref:hypothetical protein n=1 Tax=Catalinimonas alkaloidigena TaxID=1075417 RepID=UPI0024049C44|nr:hypothetical protein [Catalinimonas alkaloidigena]MDF9801440.1 hypothetical protein [Catalinimonas alkaloidigena]
MGHPFKELYLPFKAHTLCIGQPYLKRTWEFIAPSTIFDIRTENANKSARMVHRSLSSITELNMNRILPFLILLIFTTGCSFLNSSSEGYDNAVSQVNAIANGDFDEAISYFDIDLSDTAQVNQLKRGIPNIQTAITENFGTDFDLSFSKSDKKFSFSTADDEESVIEPLKVKIQIKNDTHFGIIEATINEQNNKIQYINLLNYKEEIPSYLLLYLAGLIALGVATLNIMAIRRIRKSKLKRKWLRIIGVLVFNVPTITLTALGHFSLDISFQILLGIGFSATGIEETLVTFGIPIGSIITLIMVKTGEQKRITDDKLNEQTELSANVSEVN